LKIRGNQVRLAIEAPKEVRVLRTELLDAATGKTDAAFPCKAAIESSVGLP
jgi:carbon storage regulator CsrA